MLLILISHVRVILRILENCRVGELQACSQTGRYKGQIGKWGLVLS